MIYTQSLTMPPSIEVFTIPQAFDSLESASAFHDDHWPGCPSYQTLDEANTHLLGIHVMLNEFQLVAHDIPVSTAVLLAHLVVLRTNAHRINTNCDQYHDDAIRYKQKSVDLEYELNQLHDFRSSDEREKNILKHRLDEALEKLAHTETLLQNEIKSDRDSSRLQDQVTTRRADLQATLDQIQDLRHAHKKPQSIAEKYGVSSTKPAVAVTDCPKYKDIYKRFKLKDYINFGNWFIGLRMELEHFGVLHRLHPHCNDVSVGGGPDMFADARCRRILVDSISESLINYIYKSHVSKAPHAFFKHICLTTNTGSHGRFWTAMKSLINFTATGSPDLTFQALEDIRQHLLDVGEVVPDKFLNCALLYRLSDDYKLLRSDIFAQGIDDLTIDDVYTKVRKFTGDHHLDVSPSPSGLNALAVCNPSAPSTTGTTRRSKPCPISIFGCPDSICCRRGSNDHKGNKCPVDRFTLSCTNCSTGHTATAGLSN
ncbi:hypothetical protein SARC_02757 [Sphaeroforma arctica JP610]|uniref:Uncharacterized protein n=1 Tax=Sphaeroforma arctica JP610 TaxID=667725 RepID=A0A0L0G7M0_9EUKA|nr:hypothetical protein SARC_02757 [Sphaeroforma arctica JP610]KNC85032.1 hypothetical protein SARC_02757 [Sphaeroforma arctica JP610]|eukprot:XP_014158934.1 hypothetical protein SARC_02757 [Sphaeroforma arctica JP610]